MELNIYQKLQNVRVAVQSSSMKKSGHNRNFEYFELKDFLPKANDEFAKVGLCPMFSIKKSFDSNGVANEIATLTITDGASEIVFETPTVEVVLAGSQNPIQALGAKHTYLKRYLYMNALEIAENDIVDAEEQEEPKASEKQLEIIRNAYQGENLVKLMKLNNIEKVEDLTKSKASELISKLYERNK